MKFPIRKPTYKEISVNDSKYELEYPESESNIGFTDNQIAYVESFSPKWKITYDGTNWEEISNQSSNELYVTWKKPADEVPLNTFTYENYEFKHIHSIFDISCKANNGQIISDEQVLLNNIWAVFKNSSNISYNNLLKRKDNKLLTYYKNFHTLNQTAPSMIRDVDATGQCFSFSFLFIDLQRIQGSNLVTFLNNHKNVVPKYYEPHRTLCGDVSNTLNDNPIQYFLVKNWLFEGTGLDRNRCIDLPYVLLSSTESIQNQGTNLLVKGDIKKINGIEGQNQPEPLSIFAVHSVVLINGQYYDASYGKTYSSIPDFTNHAIAGWLRKPKISTENDYNLDVNGDGQVDNKTIYSFGATNQLSTWDITIK